MMKKEGVGKEVSTAEWVLRLGVFGTFLGHGMFALGVAGLKNGWIPYFTSVGLSENSALTLLPLIGSMDVLIALVVLFMPLRIILAWASFWGFLTALVRPVSGEPVWDFFERWANWAAPLALLLVQGWPKKGKGWLNVK